MFFVVYKCRLFNINICNELSCLNLREMENKRKILNMILINNCDLKYCKYWIFKLYVVYNFSNGFLGILNILGIL